MGIIGSLFRQIQTPLESVLGRSTGSLARTLTSSLVRAGMSAASSAAFGRQRQDSLTSGAAHEFFHQKDAARSSAADITAARFSESANAYVQSVAPESVIGATSPRGRSLIYPLELRDDYFISFTFLKYNRPTPFQQAREEILETISLPIPNRLDENHTVSWTDDRQGIWAEIFDLGTGVVNEGATANTADQAAGSGARLGTNIARRLTASILPGDLERQVGQTTGAIFNPHLSMFFDSPTFQEFQFSWKFHPFSASESKNLKEICKIFKRNMLPTRAVGTSTSFLAYPSMVQINLTPETFPMKKCVVQSVNIDYTPMGHPSYFKGTKEPKFIELSVSVKAIEYFTGEDFGASPRFANSAELDASFSNTFDRAVGGITNAVSQTTSGLGQMIFGANTGG